MDIAIVGISCRTAFSDNKEEFWNILKKGKDCIQKADKRWNIAEYKAMAGNDIDHAAISSGMIQRPDFFDNRFLIYLQEKLNIWILNKGCFLKKHGNVLKIREWL
jgi:acyl transferase domain-containing protein